jgi:hypothetical protein
MTTAWDTSGAGGNGEQAVNPPVKAPSKPRKVAPSEQGQRRGGQRGLLGGAVLSSQRRVRMEQATASSGTWTRPMIGRDCSLVMACPHPPCPTGGPASRPAAKAARRTGAQGTSAVAKTTTPTEPNRVAMPSTRASQSWPRRTAMPCTPEDHQDGREQRQLLAQGPTVPGLGEVGHGQAAVGGQGDPNRTSAQMVTMPGSWLLFRDGPGAVPAPQVSLTGRPAPPDAAGCR